MPDSPFPSHMLLRPFFTTLPNDLHLSPGSATCWPISSSIGHIPSLSLSYIPNESPCLSSRRSNASAHSMWSPPGSSQAPYLSIWDNSSNHSPSPELTTEFSHQRLATTLTALLSPQSFLPFLSSLQSLSRGSAGPPRSPLPIKHRFILLQTCLLGTHSIEAIWKVPKNPIQHFYILTPLCLSFNRMGENICKHSTDHGLVTWIYKKLSKLIKKMNSPIKKIKNRKDLIDPSSERYGWQIRK